MRPIDADTLKNAIVLYMAETAYINDTAIGVWEKQDGEWRIRPIDADASKIYIIDALKLLSEMIDKSDTLDVVPVVRCKDCKHWSRWDNSLG